MKIGTKSLLFGAHTFWLHPIFVAWAWIKLYRFPREFPIWVAFVIHDWGYWGKPDMDGEEGEQHPFWAANVMHKWFDIGRDPYCPVKEGKCLWCDQREWGWYEFTLYHSRFFAKKHRRPISRLCIADKYAICLTPWWLYIPLVILSGEWKEYVTDKNKEVYVGEPDIRKLKPWFLEVQKYMKEWVMEHKDLKEDTWTPERKRDR